MLYRIIVKKLSHHSIVAPDYSLTIRPPDHPTLRPSPRPSPLRHIRPGPSRPVLSAGAAPAKVAERGPGTSFGELALLYNSPRAATITALADAVVWAIHRVPFRRTLKRVNVKKIDEYSKARAGQMRRMV